MRRRLDTNALICAHIPESPHHAEVRSFLLGQRSDEYVTHSYGRWRHFTWRIPWTEVPSLLTRNPTRFPPQGDYGSSPPTLCRYLAQDPSFFVDVISRVYRPRLSETWEEDAAPNGETQVELGEVEQAVAGNAYRLLSNWRILPGEREDGTIDGVFLRQWVNEARRLLREVHRTEGGDTHIGMIFAASPADPDGSWPSIEVRGLLETLQSAEIENGLEIQLHNNRGATSRGMLDGGDQERELVAKYREQADRFTDRWPRTAAVLRSLADSYEREARRFEGDAERRRTGFES